MLRWNKGSNMRIEHDLFRVLGIAPKFRRKGTPGNLLLIVLRRYLLFVNWSKCFMSYFVFFC